jgi:hypothetical protein
MFSVFLSYLETSLDDNFISYLREDLLGVFNSETEANDFRNEILEYLPNLRKEVIEGISEMENLGYNQDNCPKESYNWFHSELIPLDLLLSVKDNDFSCYYKIKQVPSKISLFTLQKPNTEDLLPNLDSAQGNFVFAELLKNL